MFRDRIRLTASALILAACAIPATPLADQARLPVAVTDALDLYEARPDGTIPKRLAQWKFIDVLSLYRDQAGHWISRAPVEARPRKQRVAAALAVELVAATLDGSFDDYKASKPLIEWTSALMRQQPPTEFERLAILASLAAMQGAGDSELFGIESGPKRRRGQIDHALDRFPNDVEMRFTRLVERRELRVIATVPVMAPTVLPVGADRRMADDAAKRFNDTLNELTGFEGTLVNDEAQMRRGVFLFVKGRSTLAMQDFGVLAVSQQRFPAYIANLMLGSIYYSGGDTSSAAARYSRALSLVPATSARLGLAAALMKLGSVQEAADVAMPALPDARIEDPWRVYGLGRFHELPAYLEKMRAALR